MIPDNALEVVGPDGKVVIMAVTVFETFGSMSRSTRSEWKPKEPKAILIALVTEPILGPRDWSPRYKPRKKDYEVVCHAPKGSSLVIQLFNDRNVMQDIRIDLVRGDAEVAILDRATLSYG